MADPRRQPIVLELQRQGWQFVMTTKNHLKGIHPDASRPIWLPGTPSSPRNDTRIRALARRSLEKTS
jgi:hypothetical protein